MDDLSPRPSKPAKALKTAISCRLTTARGSRLAVTSNSAALSLMPSSCITWASLRGVRGSPARNTVGDVLADTPPPSPLRISSSSWILARPGDAAFNPIDGYVSMERVKRALLG
eukprot:1663472-Pleurochrysis_carterae.AAC.6